MKNDSDTIWLTAAEVAERHFPGRSARWVRDALIKPRKVRVMVISEKCKLVDEGDLLEFMAMSTRRSVRHW